MSSPFPAFDDAGEKDSHTWFDSIGRRNSDGWYRDLVEHSHDLLCVHDLNGRLLSVNPAPARVLGYSVEELLTIPLRELIAPEFRVHFDAYLQQIAEVGEASGLMTVVTRSGERRTWEFHNTLRTEGVPAPIVRGIAHDVTERVHAQKLLGELNEKLRAEAEERERSAHALQLFRSLVDHSTDAIELTEPETLRFLDANETACSRLGYTREELLGLSVYDIDPEITTERHQHHLQLLRGNRAVTLESVHRRKDGSVFPVELSVKRVCLDREYIVAVARDITKRKKALEALSKSEAHFRMLVEQASDGIFVSDAKGNYSDVNSAGAAMLGYSREEILRLSIADVVVPGEVSRIGPEIGRLEEGRITRAEWQFRRKDGSEFPGEVTGRQLPDGRLQAILRDMTEHKRNEATLRTTLEQLRAAKEKLAEEKLYLEEAIDDELGFGEIIGQSRVLKEVMAQVATVAASDATVLILGETGTGKELIARAVHRLSRRRNSSFIKMNCAAIPSGLLESELFGHEKGAFTGAVDRKVGRLELADEGTLFLDEIGEIPLSMQPKLLRVLQDQEFERLGANRTVQVNFRLIAATNRDLSEEVERREFRSDLYYRIKVFPILVPPLRERKEDIPLLVEHFVRKCGKRMNRSITSIPTKTMDALMEWDWAGNIRELENFVERSVILSEGSVLRAPLGELANRKDSASSLEAAEREHIVRVLQDCEGKLAGRHGAAARLGLKRTTLQSKLKRMGIRYRGEEG